MRKKIIFSYDGSKFNGLQRQKNTRTVQKTGRTTKIDENSIHINNMESIPKVKKLKMLKYLLINNGIKGLANYGSQNKQAKEEIKILSR